MAAIHNKMRVSNKHEPRINQIKTEEEEDDLFQSNGHSGKKKLNHQRNLLPQIHSDFAESKRASKLNTGSIGNILEKYRRKEGRQRILRLSSQLR
eukprot:403371647